MVGTMRLTLLFDLLAVTLSLLLRLLLLDLGR